MDGGESYIDRQDSGLECGPSRRADGASAKRAKRGGFFSWFVKGDVTDGFHGREAVLVEPRHVSWTAEKFAAGGGVHAGLGQGPCAPGPRPKRGAGGVRDGVAQTVHAAQGAAVVDGAGDAGEGGVGLIRAFADDGAHRVSVVHLG